MKHISKVSVSLLITFVIFGFVLQDTKKNPYVQIQTELGNITIELYPATAPVTVLNSRQYIDSGFYKQSCFYRVVRQDNQPHDSVKIAVIQGGRWKNEQNGFPQIRIETTKTTGILHKNGVISMARSTPNSATSEFFICVGDQPELDFGGKRNKDGYGFAAFGKVLEGMEVVQSIHRIHATGQYLEKPVIIFNIINLNR
jgi:peptidyl-prolyl cis-trans isomerase A (cyclophilin A)